MVPSIPLWLKTALAEITLPRAIWKIMRGAVIDFKSGTDTLAIGSRGARNAKSSLARGM
ncbi:hypothetical protein RRH01S_29_00340 [Rhizobium rhizogenes NBRC 13257]|uniref:Uncharacterized protein n=1 Tax=Rhizobium rhizogenes NBRC 13257 TaxID=1220581 RepID=A0AA87QAZ1_RHIRH|nr:hypothetical protein RRH01S_29_00340 [Rhizobium rhizogenes NBRC 13257]